ncbi:MAG: D-alanyl-D-alanine carboxypeptidase [Caedimonadaceae bacterium]|nr:MAG: D-alanyl-D-alanine carboxypeptidase [Caedimonadaceae bacterium]
MIKMNHLKKKSQIFTFILGTVIALGVSEARALEIHSKQAILIDLTTHTVLFSKNPKEPTYPSSMTKMMTAYLAFEEIKAGRFKLEQTFSVSENAWRKQGSKMFLPMGGSVSILDLLKGIIISSGNDAAICMAEGIAGTEEAFAEMMTKRAHDLGAVNTTFKNASGWPDPEQVTTVEDLAIIAERTIKDFPEFYDMYKETEFTYHNIHQQNRNPLLYANLWADGLKTGHTDLGGYGLTASTLNNGRRLVLVINGAESKKDRADDSKALIRYGYNMFESPLIFKENDVVESVDVWLGNEAKVNLIVDKDLYITVPRPVLKDVKVVLNYPNPIAAPINKGDVVGSVVVHVPGSEPVEVKLKAEKSVSKAGAFSRFKAMIHYLFWGHN